MESAKRSPAADLIRILAFFSVVAVHFFLNNEFYTQIVEGERMFVMTIMRSFFIICVPLFLTLSGYLLRKKELGKKYYKRIGKIIITYLLASFLCVFYSAFFLKQDLTVKKVILDILNFMAAPYSWYIEMYLGLFLLIPFLNIVYNKLSKKQKLLLILTFVILTALPSVLNIYNFDLLGWWTQPSLSPDTNKLIPAWWQTLYPITYYYIGCYLSEYGLKINKVLNLALIIVLTVLSGSFCYWRSYKSVFVWGAWCDYQSLFNVILTLLVFALIINTDFEKMPVFLSKFIQKISGLCLGGYLVSWIFDQELYPRLLAKVPSMPHRLEYFIIIVPIVFVLSLLASYALSKIQFLLEKLFSFIWSIAKRKNTKNYN